MRLLDGWLSSYEYDKWMEYTYSKMPEWYGNTDLKEGYYLDFIEEGEVQ